MTFGEKLSTLRKSKGLSQEALSEKLNTSRQAISKWENGQGFPETEKLIMLGNIFDVSLDYLLKDTLEHDVENEQGYYVNKETAEGFLMTEDKISKRIAFGISLILSSYIPYLIFQHSFKIYSIIIAIMISTGIAVLLSTSFMEDEYKKLKKEPLLFDERVLKEFKNKYSLVRKKYTIFLTIGISLIFAAGSILLLFDKGLGSGENLTAYYSICTFVIVVGLYLVIYFSSMIEAYEIIVNNETHINKLSFKLLKIFRKKKELL